MMVGQIFTKIGTFIENRQIFMLLNCNCSKLANFKDFSACLGGGRFFEDTVYNWSFYVLLSMDTVNIFLSVNYTRLT